MKKSPDIIITTAARANHDNKLYSDSPLELIDILVVDSKSRITFSHKIKKILSVYPNDKLLVYHTRQNNNLLLQIRRNDAIVIDNWILTYNNGSNSSSEFDSFNRKSVNEIKDNKLNKSIKPDKKDLYQTPILLVDDEKDLLESFDALLKSKGYGNVKSFCKSTEVLEHFKELDKFKLAVLDIRMPDINGIQLYTILKILNPSIKILLMTALDAANELVGIHDDLKEDDIIPKPTDINQFIERVQNKITS